jgi:hypothetical protein
MFFCDFVFKIFHMHFQNEDEAKAMLIGYAKDIAPSLNEDEILNIIYNYTGLYSFENTILTASRNKEATRTRT